MSFQTFLDAVIPGRKPERPALTPQAEAKQRQGFGKLTPKTCSSCGHRRDVLTKAEAARYTAEGYVLLDAETRKSMCAVGRFAIDSPTVQRCRTSWTPISPARP